MTERDYDPGVQWDDSRGCYNVERDGPYLSAKERGEASGARYSTLEDQARERVTAERARQIHTEFMERGAAAVILYSAWIWERSWWEWVWQIEIDALNKELDTVPFGDPRFHDPQNQKAILNKRLRREKPE